MHAGDNTVIKVHHMLSKSGKPTIMTSPKAAIQRPFDQSRFGNSSTNCPQLTTTNTTTFSFFLCTSTAGGPSQSKCEPTTCRTSDALSAEGSRRPRKPRARALPTSALAAAAHLPQEHQAYLPGQQHRHEHSPPPPLASKSPTPSPTREKPSSRRPTTTSSRTPSRPAPRPQRPSRRT